MSENNNLNQNQHTSEYNNNRNEENKRPNTTEASPAPPRDEQRRGKKIGCLGVIGIIAIIGALCMAGLVIIMIALAFLIPGGAAIESGKITEKTIKSSPGARGKIVVVNVKGMIHSNGRLEGAETNNLRAQMQQVIKDSSVKALVLDMNTPGGGVTASDEIHQAVQTVKKHNIPVVVCMRSVCASGGYYIASAADHIMASPTTLTGSIGVLVPQFKYAELLDKIGVTKRSYTSGKMKDMFSGSVKRSPEEKEKIENYIQSLVDKTFRDFLEVIAKGRKNFKNVEEVAKAPFADGRVLLADDAKKQGLIDSLGYFDDAIEKAADLSGTPNPKVVRYRTAISLTDFIRTFKHKQEIRLDPDIIPPQHKLSPYKLYYMMQTFR